MPPKRQLAAIMFTDIEGYTAFTQEDEALAIQLRNVHRTIFKAATATYGGRILQYYGDGTLSIFDSAVAAVNCGIELQLAFLKSPSVISEKNGLPVRIGIHLGDITYSEEDIIGDSVNIASRIESLASTGSVLISAKVYDEVKNHTHIEAVSMGEFNLKNIELPIELFAISNPGLVVPDPKSLQGKGKMVKKEEHFLKKIWDQGHLQLMAAYFIGVWGLIQFTEWIINRYQISPHWIDMMLLFFLSLSPAIFLFVWNRERIKIGKIRQREKLFFTGNLLSTALLLLFFFNEIDLGSTSRQVQYNNEDGIQESRMITKPGFRKKLAVHNFIPENPDAQTKWLTRGIHAAIAEDLNQNEFLNIGFWDQTPSLQEIISSSRDKFYTYCLTGAYAVEGEIYQITTKLYRTKGGKLVKSHVLRGRDFFALVDSISILTKIDLGLNSQQIERFVDLPFVEAFTSNLEAYKNYTQFFQESQLSYLEQAIALDPTFALAYYVKAEFLHNWSLSSLGAREAIEKAMEYRKRLPVNWESGVRRLYFQITDQPDKAIALLKMKLEIDPEDQTAIQELTNYLYLTSRYDKLLQWRKKLATADPSPNNKMNVAEALLLNGSFDQAGQTIMDVLEEHPNNADALGSLTMYYVLTGQIDLADSLLQHLLVMDPEMQPLVEHFQAAFSYAKDHPQHPDSLQRYTGRYRLQARALEFDINTNKYLLYGKGRIFMGGFFFIPSAPEEFLMGNENLLEKWKFNSDASGSVYQIEAFRLERNKQSYYNVLWRQDSLILKAMGMFALNQNEAALEAFKAAYEHNPEHFYLNQYIKHLEFILDPSNKAALDNLKNFAGRYGPRQIWLENNKVYYTRDGQVAKQQLLPITPDKFYFYGGFEYQMQVVVEHGKVKGTVSWHYNNTSGQFERDDQDFFSLDELED